MGYWNSYSIEHIIPFTADIYLRLIERTNAFWWPLHPAALAIAIAALALATPPHRRFCGPLLAVLWVWSSYGFLRQFYAELTWAGHWFAWAFWLQAALLALVLPAVAHKTALRLPPLLTGLTLAAAGLLWPLITLPGREPLQQLELAGVHPDPTAVLTLGLLPLVLPTRWLWLLLPIPLAWCLLSGLTQWALALPQAWALFTVTAVALLSALIPKNAIGLARR